MSQSSCVSLAAILHQSSRGPQTFSPVCLDWTVWEKACLSWTFKGVYVAWQLFKLLILVSLSLFSLWSELIQQVRSLTDTGLCFLGFWFATDTERLQVIVLHSVLKFILMYILRQFCVCWFIIKRVVFSGFLGFLFFLFCSCIDSPSFASLHTHPASASLALLGSQCFP